MSAEFPTSDTLDGAFWVWEDDYAVPEPALGPIHSVILNDPVSQLNVPAPIILREDDTVALAVERMRKRRYGSALVADDSGCLCGIFTEHDLVRVAAEAASRGASWSQIPLSDVMTPNPQCLTEDDPLSLALHHMAVGEYRHLPVVRDGRPIGFVSIRGILKYIARSVAL